MHLLSFPLLLGIWTPTRKYAFSISKLKKTHPDLTIASSPVMIPSVLHLIQWRNPRWCNPAAQPLINTGWQERRCCCLCRLPIELTVIIPQLTVGYFNYFAIGAFLKSFTSGTMVFVRQRKTEFSWGWCSSLEPLFVSAWKTGIYLTMCRTKCQFSFHK